MVVFSPATYCMCVAPSTHPLTVRDLFFVLTQMNVEKLKKMAGAVRTGGKGSMRRCILLVPSTCAAVVALINASTFRVVFERYFDPSLHINKSV